MRKYVPVLMILAAGCATAPAPTSKPKPAPAVEAAPGITAERIGRICALPDAAREVELEKLKRESGMVLYCGNK